jgi:hypothetical protein
MPDSLAFTKIGQGKEYSLQIDAANSEEGEHLALSIGGCDAVKLT